MKSMSAALTLVAVLFAGCRSNTSVQPAPPRPARINHLAFFKLKDPTQSERLIADLDSKLATIPGVVSYYRGRHLDVGRPTVDGDYDVGFYVGFMTEAAYAAYVEHPAHVDVVTTWRPHLEWLRVHDVLDER